MHQTQSFDDDALFYDIRINLLKVDATRAMKVNYRARGKNKNVTQDISAGKTYFISHFAEFGAYYEEEQVKAIFKAIKRQEAQRNPYLPYEPFALVTSDKDLTQEYINRIVDYKNYKGEFKEEEEVEEEEDNKPLLGDPLVEMIIVHNYSAPNSGGKFGCSRVGIGCANSTMPNLPKYANMNKVHGGVDLYCPLNTKVYSMFDGVVEKIVNEVTPNNKGTWGDFGNRIRIKSTSKQHVNNGKTIYVYYTHLNNVENLELGEEVKQGQLLGLSGKTGNAHNIPVWRYHTHISIYEDGTSGNKRVNPLRYFASKNLENKNN